MFKKVAIAAAIAAMSFSANALVINFEGVDAVVNAATAANGGVYTGFALPGIRGTGTGANSDLTTTNNNSNLIVNNSWAGMTWAESAAGNLQLYSEYRALSKLTAAVNPYISPSGAADASPFGNWIAVVNSSASTVTFSQASAFNLTHIDFFASKANEVITVTATNSRGTVGTWSSAALTAGTVVQKDFSFLGATSVTIASTKGALGFDNISITAVPEPSTYAMLLAGLGMMGFIARRRTRA